MTLRRKILAIFCILILLTFAGYWFISRTLAREQLATQNAADLQNFADMIERQLESGHLSAVESSTAGLRGMRLTLVAKDGKVIFDSFESADVMENHLTRPEVKAALSGSGTSMRYSETFRAWMNYYARKISTPNGEIILRLASPVKEIEENFAHFGSKFLIWAVPLILVLSLSGLWLTKRLFIPLEEIIRAAGKIKFDESSVKMKFLLQGDGEIQRLANALNEMGERLDGALGDIKRRREELSRIVEALPVGVVLTDDAHRIRYVNALARELLGETTGISKGGIVQRLLPTKEMSEMLEQPDTIKEFHFPQRKQHLKVATVSIAGAGVGKLFVIRDLANEKNVEAMRRNFIIDAGHEFQTPLTIIRMAAELLRDSENSGDDEKNLEKIIIAQERLTGLVDELLLLTRAESLPDSSAQKINLPEMIREIVSNLDGHPVFSKTRFEFELENALTIDGHYEEFKRAISNIIENALKYSSEKENPFIKICAKKENDRVKISVADNGIGISDEAAKHIFEPFRRGDAARNGGGYGLGLSISKRIIEAMGGKISASKNQEEGSTFTVDII